MRPKIVLIVVVPVVLFAVIVREVRLAGRLAALAIEKEQLVAERDSFHALLEQLEGKVTELQVRSEAPATIQPESALENALARLTALETALGDLSPANRQDRGWRPAVPEYDPTQPLPEPFQLWPTNATPKRAWGPEQVTGPPDTDRAGDFQTAWASREPDRGAEWLRADFDRPVELGQVRVRETYNPGAISKITAVVSGQEFLLWEGTAGGGQAPRDFVVNAPAGLYAQSVVVQLDTSRVAGWNEIDAIGLVGRDGSRQWASAVNASSTYADRSGPALATNPGQQEVIIPTRRGCFSVNTWTAVCQNPGTFARGTVWWGEATDEPDCKNARPTERIKLCHCREFVQGRIRSRLPLRSVTLQRKRGQAPAMEFGAPASGTAPLALSLRRAGGRRSGPWIAVANRRGACNVPRFCIRAIFEEPQDLSRGDLKRVALGQRETSH
jgi:hypothetical protein